MIRIGHVLCPIDFSPFSARALRHAAAWSRWYGAQLTVLHVWHDVPAANILPSLQAPPPTETLPDAQRVAIEARMRQYCAEITPDTAVVCRVTQAPNVQTDIVERADSLGADLIVMGSHGRSGFERALLGSVAERVVRKAPCPVLVVPGGDEVAPTTVQYKHIVCAVDFSPTSLATVSVALSLAEEADATVELLHVLELPPELQAVSARGETDIYQIRAAADADILRRLRALVPAEAREFCQVQSAVAEGKAHREILKAAVDQHADLIVMGVSGHGAIDRWVFGSTTASVLRGAHCPVLIARTPPSGA